MHGRCHQRREAGFIGKVNARTGVNKAPDGLPILLQGRNQKQGAPLRDARVRIEMLGEIQLDEGLTVYRYGPGKIVR